MGNKGIIFAITVVVVLVTAGALITLGKNKNGSTKNKVGQENKQMYNKQTNDDSGQVAGETSTKYKEDLAKFLTEKGAVLYGAYWCPHCKSQKELFGDAAKYINYVECDASGENANPDECAAKEITGYPTWIYDGQKKTGQISLSELAEMVGFRSDEGKNQDGTTPPAVPGVEETK